LVKATIERRDFWRLLKSMAGLDQAVDIDQITSSAQMAMAQKLTQGLLALAKGGDASNLSAMLSDGAIPGDIQAAGGAADAVSPAGYEPVWIETPECTACDECMEINPKIFAYNDDKLAIIVNPKGGTFKDIVKAAEKCTAEVIHPGTPPNPNEKGLDKLIKRAQKYQ